MNEIERITSNALTAVMQEIPGLVCMLCGIAGSGKTTAAKVLVERGFSRLSIDEWIWQRHGRFGVDYQPAAHQDFMVAAELALREELIQLMRKQLPVIVDFSFWQCSRRELYRSLIKQEHRSCILLYFKASRALLLERLRNRSSRFDANAAFSIDEALLERYISGFEEPRNEGEIVIVADDLQQH